MKNLLLFLTFFCAYQNASANELYFRAFCLEKGLPLTDATLRSIPNPETITMLNLALCENITDDGLAFIAQQCSHMEDLNLSNCIHISLSGICSIIGACTNLKNLNICGCTQIRTVYLLPLLKKHPGLQIICYDF